MPSFDLSLKVQHIIPYLVPLKWLLLLSSLFNLDDEIREIPSRWDCCACVHTVYSPISTQAPHQGTSCQFCRAKSGVGWQNWRRQEILWCWSEPAGGKYGQIWPVLSIMSRWNGLYQITNLELITKVVAGLCFIPSPTLPSLLSGESCRHLSCLSHGSPPLSPEHNAGCFINSVSPDYTLSVSQGTLIDI